MGNRCSCFRDTSSTESFSRGYDFQRLPDTTIDPDGRLLKKTTSTYKPQRKKSTKKFDVNVDCGSDKNDFNADDNVSLYGSLSKTYRTTAAIKGNSPQYMNYGKTSRAASDSFIYNIVVPKPGTYDVSLVFCEIDKSCFATGKRIFSVSVLGKERMDWEDIDVFAKSGKNTPYIIKINQVEAQARISIVLRKGKAGDPFISGFNARAAKLEEKTPETIPLKEPNVSVDKAEYDAFIKKISSYTTNLKKTSPTRYRNVPTFVYSEPLRAEPTFMFHNPETKVRGLLVNFHGFSSSQHDYRIFNRYMYDQGFDIFNAVLAGHAYSADHWPQTVLKNAEEIQVEMENNPEIKVLLEEAEKNPTDLDKVFKKLARESQAFFKMQSTTDYMSYVDDSILQDKKELFDSNHMDYLEEALTQLDIFNDYPGPIFLCGVSLGATIALAAAAARPHKVKRVIAMSPVFQLHEFVPETKLPFVKYLGPLNTEKKGYWGSEEEFPLSALTAVSLFGQSVARFTNTKRLFRSRAVEMFMVLSEDDDLADVTASNDYFYDCGGHTEEHQYYIYPKSRRVPHMLLDPTKSNKGMSNASYAALYQNCFRFFTTGSINHDHLQENTLDDSILHSPEAIKGNTEFYEQAFKTRKISNFSVVKL